MIPTFEDFVNEMRTYKGSLRPPSETYSDWGKYNGKTQWFIKLWFKEGAIVKIQPLGEKSGSFESGKNSQRGTASKYTCVDSFYNEHSYNEFIDYMTKAGDVIILN